MNGNYHTISYCCKGAQVQLGTSPTDMGLATWITIQHDNELRDFIHPISIYFPKCNLFVQFFPTHQPLSQSQGRLRAIQSFLAFSVSGWHLAVASFLVRQFFLSVDCASSIETGVTQVWWDLLPTCYALITQQRLVPTNWGYDYCLWVMIFVMR